MKVGGVSLGLSMLSIVIGIVAICVSTYRAPELGFDYQGVLVGVLSLLVTMLIGWQIYTLIDIRKLQEGMRNAIDESKFNSSKNEYIVCHSIADIFYALSIGDNPISYEQQFIYYRISQLLHASDMKDIAACNSVVKVLLEVVINPKLVNVTKSGKRDMINLLCNVKNSEQISRFDELMERIAHLNGF